MSTRRAPAESAPSFERYMSSPHFVETRGIAGNLVAAKAELYEDARHRQMIFFLQQKSVERGGLRRIAAEIVNRWPERLGCAAMHDAGISPETSYDEATREKIGSEIDFQPLASLHLKRFQDSFGAGATRSARTRSEGWDTTAESYLVQCRELAIDVHGLRDFLEALCLDPSIDLADLEGAWWHGFCPFVIDLWKSLTELKAEAEGIGPVPFVQTTVSRQMHSALDFALRAGRMVIVEGLAGCGKTTAAREWVRRHPGEARFVSLSGITHRTGFFSAIGQALGLATSQRKACELQAKIETFFTTSRLMLVLDEAHHAWPKGKRLYVAPELIDWINTALVNAGAPVALICTDQFSRLRENVEKQTGWTSEQLTHRVKRFVKLPEHPTHADLSAVAESLLSMVWDEGLGEWLPSTIAAEPDAVEVAVARVELRQKLRLAALRDAVDEARNLAREAGRSQVLFDDVDRAFEEFQQPSDLALQAAFAPALKVRPGSQKSGGKAGSKNRAFIGDLTPRAVAKRAPLFISNEPETERSAPVSATTRTSVLPGGVTTAR